MTRQEAINEACSIMCLAYRSIGDYSESSDCFCDGCVFQGDSYRNKGKALDYVRMAVHERLLIDGYKIAEGFDKATGKEVKE